MFFVASFSALYFRLYQLIARERHDVLLMRQSREEFEREYVGLLQEKAPRERELERSRVGLERLRQDWSQLESELQRERRKRAVAEDSMLTFWKHLLATEASLQQERRQVQEAALRIRKLEDELAARAKPEAERTRLLGFWARGRSREARKVAMGHGETGVEAGGGKRKEHGWLEGN